MIAITRLCVSATIQRSQSHLLPVLQQMLQELLNVLFACANVSQDTRNSDALVSNLVMVFTYVLSLVQIFLLFLCEKRIFRLAYVMS
jgi:hypothetical protein